MSQPTDVLLLDNGELEDVREILEDLELSFVRASKGDPIPPQPPKVVIATPFGCNPPTASSAAPLSGERPIGIVISDVEAGSSPGRFGAGFDYLVRRPFHPEALRLLIQSCLYAGTDRRVEPRAAVGCNVEVMCDGERHHATLVDLSYTGCRLLMAEPYDVGTSLTFILSEELGASAPFELSGEIVRCDIELRLRQREGFVTAVAWRALGGEVRRELNWVLEIWASGPGTVDGASAEPGSGDKAGQPAPATVELEPDEASAESGAAAQRPQRQPRTPYPKRVHLLDGAQSHAIIARDISRGGMKIDPIPKLELGDCLKLLVYHQARSEPLEIAVHVARDDGPSGLVLHFNTLDEATSTAIDRLLSGPSPIESLHDGQASSGSFTVAEVVRMDRPES